MFFRTAKIILHLDSSSVTVADHRTNQPSYYNTQYNSGELNHVLEQIIHKFEGDTYKIILDSTVSYTVRWEKKGSDLPTRDQVYLDLIAEIPEEFTDSQFDWKILNDSQIEAVVVKNNIFHELQSIRNLYPQLKLETQSTLSLLLEMGSPDTDEKPTPELFQYAASVGTLHGSDAKVLNIKLDPVAPIKSTKIARPRLPSPIILTLTVILLLVGSIVAYVLNQGGLTSKKVVSTPTPAPSYTPSPSPIPLKQVSDFTTLIQNGTTTTGLAGQYQLKFENAGFTQVETGNSATPASSTTLTISESLPDAIQQTILDLLSPRIPEISIAPNQFDRDIVIILGTN